MSNPDQDAGIPMLTEIIPAPEAEVREDMAAAEDIPELPLSSVLPSPSPPLPAVTPPPAAPPVRATPIDDWMDGEWTHLEQRISERTLNTLLDRLDPLLEQQIRESISASLDEAMDTIRTNLQLSIEQLVRESVAQEIRHLNFSKNKKI